ncbi:unnamed protein product [Urochloa decumbens]|uniref:Peroxidase n=1 Tax=Urochloa decumbens TaxID=240449 RepID=A0ABC9B7T0_9POAL
MGAQETMKRFVRLLLLVQAAAVLLSGPGAAELSMDYYAMSCPYAEYIVRNVVGQALMKDPTLAGSILRLHFHDCFVQGCDASVLLDSTDDNTAEKDAPANKSLRGFEVIDGIKEALEAQCPGIVSCADVLALAARDAVFMARGPYYGVPLGRRDGSRSVASDTFLALPPPVKNVTLLIQIFGNVGLDVHDMVALSGGHTLGIAHCANFKDRIKNEVDTLDASLASSLGSVCRGGDSKTAPFDRTSTRFDGVYYRELTARRGLLSSDQTLFESPETKEMVGMFAMYPDYFFYAFQQGMLKMGQISLKEGDEGEVRNSCRVVNS